MLCPTERTDTNLRPRWRIVLADDHELIREGVAAVIAREPELTICGSAADEKTAAELVARHRPDLLLIDLAISQRDALSLLRDIITTCPATRVLALAAYEEKLYAERLLCSGASGYLVKSAAATELVQAIRVVAGGGTYANPRLECWGQRITNLGSDARAPEWAGARAQSGSSF